jgi:hypothetical protein
MQYQVPQFIEIEDKIFGPLTFKQFLYVGGGAAIAFIAWSFLPSFLALPVGGGILAFFLAAAFYKVNGRPFLFFIENFFKFHLSRKLFLWDKEKKTPKKGDRGEKKEESKVQMPKLSQSKLKELTWGLDVHENLEINVAQKMGLKK